MAQQKFNPIAGISKHSDAVDVVNINAVDAEDRLTRLQLDINSVGNLTTYSFVALPLADYTALSATDDTTFYHITDA